MVHRTSPAILYVETTTRCNLRCSMCVKQTAHAHIPERDMPFSVFRELAPAFSSLEGLVLNGIGEPLLNSHLEAMVRFARAEMPQEAWIGFQTNGLLMDAERALGLVQDGLDTVCLSVDAVCGDGVGIHHGGEDVGLVDAAFSALREAGRRTGRNVRLGIELVLMRDTFRSLPRTLEWAAARGASFAIVTHMLPYHKGMASQSLFNPNTSESLSFFQEWAKRARERNLDLTEYVGGLWRFPKSDQRKGLEQLVKDMNKEAVRKGIPLHLAHLLRWTGGHAEAEQQELHKTLRSARARAADLGIELTLPSESASLDRCCEFVEKGVMHISPEGDVHPCYALWHEYSSVMDGEHKRIMPRVFGNVCDHDALAIWNDSSYREFRDAVLEYDYPHCGNCNVAPCSDVRGYSEGFINDCHGVQVPCGHCEWCTGGIRCLI